MELGKGVHLEDREFPLEVDNRIPFQRVVELCDCQPDLIPNCLTEENFPDKGSGVVKLVVRLVYFDEMMSRQELLVAVANLKAKGFRPLTTREILAFGAAYKNEQKMYPIVALGSDWVDEDDCHNYIY